MAQKIMGKTKKNNRKGAIDDIDFADIGSDV